MNALRNSPAFFVLLFGILGCLSLVPIFMVEGIKTLPYIILMAFFIYAIYFYSISIAQDFSLFLLILLMFYLKVFFAFFDAEIHILPGMEKDPINFYNQAIAYNQGKYEISLMSGSSSFKVFLSWVYDVFGKARFFGNFLSVVASSVAMILFYECLRVLDVTYKKIFLFIFCMHPSFFIHSVVTIREAYLTMFVLIFVLLTLRFFIDKKNIILYFYASMLSLALLPLFHVKGFYLFSVVACIAFFSFMQTQLKNKKILLSMLLLVPIVFSFKGSEFITIMSGNNKPDIVLNESSVVEESSVLSGLNSYLSKTQSGEERTRFKVTVDTSSFSELMKTGPVAFYHYMTAPMPWSYSGDKRDLLPMAESVFRLLVLVLIGFYFLIVTVGKKQYFKDQHFELKIPNKFLFYLLLLYLAQCGIWSLGTANYGQAFRHHVPSLPILVLCLGLVITNITSIKTSFQRKLNYSE